MDSTELGDRIVAVFEENTLVELLGPLRSRVRNGVISTRDSWGKWGGCLIPPILHKLVEEKTPERFRRARIAREERALHHLGKIGEREDRAVEIRDVGRERRAFLGREPLPHRAALTRSPGAQRRRRRPRRRSREGSHADRLARTPRRRPTTAAHRRWPRADLPAPGPSARPARAGRRAG